MSHNNAFLAIRLQTWRLTRSLLASLEVIVLVPFVILALHAQGVSEI